MPDIRDQQDTKEDTFIPRPDPWAPPGAAALQAGSIATGATGVALLAGNEPASGTVDGMIALLPDPHQVFSGAVHLLGFQFNASAAWTWGFLLVVLSVALNITSYALRYRWARQVETDYAAKVAADKSKEDELQRQTAAQGGFVPGDA